MSVSPPSAELAHWLATQHDLTLLMAHDLRNPLAAVLANLNFLELAIKPEETDVLEAVGDIKVSAETLLRMVENLVTIARLESDARTSLHLAPVDVAATARVAFERVIPTARASGVDLRLEVRSEPALAHGEASLVEQLLENLLGNSVQHVRRGGHARLTLEARDGVVALDLEDDGPAFGTAERDFTRDGQLELKKKPDARYSRGLALYVAGLVVRALGGSVTVDPSAGRGRLAITLPAAR